MAKLSTYATATPVLGDYILGTDDPAGTPLTRNFTFTAARDLLQANITKLTIAAAANNNAIAITGYSLTGADASSLLDLAGTWNTSGAPSAILLNLTHTAVGAGANLLDLRSTLSPSGSKFKVDADGQVTINSGTAAGTNPLTIQYSSSTILQLTFNGTLNFLGGGTPQISFQGIAGQNLLITKDVIQWNGDLFIQRDAADTLALRNATSDQKFSVYSNFVSSTDFHRVSMMTTKTTLSGVTGASVTATNLIPDGAVVVGVTTKVTTGLGTTGGTTGYQVGDGSDPDRWGAITGTIAGTSSDNRDWTATTVQAFTAANNVVITAVGGNFDGTGAIAVSVQYLIGEVD